MQDDTNTTARNAQPVTPVFDLYVPVTRTGKTHLSTENRIGILCGDYKERYRTFTVMGIVPAGTATCADCNREAQAIVDQS